MSRSTTTRAERGERGRAQKAENGATSHARAISRPKRTTGSSLEEHLAHSLAANGVPAPVRELVFHPPRKFRLDFAWPAQRLAVEIEGGVYRGGGHTSVTGLKRDIEKGNLLTMDGWRVLRFHGDQVKSGEAVALIRQALEV